MIDTWFLNDIVEMITTNKFPNAIVDTLIAAMDDFMLFGAYIETFHNINYNIMNKI